MDVSQAGNDEVGFDESVELIDFRNHITRWQQVSCLDFSLSCKCLLDTRKDQRLLMSENEFFNLKKLRKNWVEDNDDGSALQHAKLNAVKPTLDPLIESTRILEELDEQCKIRFLCITSR